MEDLYNSFYRQLRGINQKFVRYLYPLIDWNSRLIAITGARGTGKSTLILQHIRKTFGLAPSSVMYLSLDHIYFSEHRLYDFGTEFVKQGGKYLFLDEVHKYLNWSQEIKNLYDNYPELHIVFTGSSMLEIYKGNADLSRRVIHYFLAGMSFREYLIFENIFETKSVSLEYLLKNHLAISQQINAVLKPLPHFQNYLRQGYYPYYKESKNLYATKLLNTLNVVLETDLPAIEKIELYSILKIKRLLIILSQLVPFTPNITELSAQLDVSRNSLLNYLSYLEKSQITNLLFQNTKGMSGLSKPQKIYLNNTNLSYALGGSSIDIGSFRETFFFNQLRVVADVTYSPQTDFTINKSHHFEIGGKNKGSEQLTGLPNAYLALDNIESGFGNKIPLWMFGFLY